MKTNKKTILAFSLIELSIVILIIGILVIGISKGSRIIFEARIKSSRSLTTSSPVLSTDGLLLWLEPVLSKSFQNSNNSYDVVDGDSIKNWVDLNPINQNSYIATESTIMPTYKKNGLGNLPCLFFNANNAGTSGQTLQIPYDKNLNGSEFTIFVVHMPLEVTNNYGALIDNRDDGAISGYTFYKGPPAMGSAYNFTIGYNGVGWQGFTTPGSVAFNKGAILEFKRTSTASTFYLSGQTPSVLDVEGNPRTIAYLPNQTHSFQIGALNSTYYFDGYVSEIILFNRALKDSERKGIETYLSQKYSIKLS